jgi:uncharacterized protein involved in exopolysaccharide biosynthesis
MRSVGRPAARVNQDPLAGGYAAHGSELDLGVLAAALWRRKAWIILPTLLALIGSAAFVSTLTPLYKSEARLLLEPRETAFTRPTGDALSGEQRTVDEQAVRSQVELITSVDLGRDVARQLGLAGNPEFDPQAATPGLTARLLGLVGLASQPPTGEDRVLKAYFEALTAYSIDRSRVIAIEFASRDPAFAADAANAIADRYLAERGEAKRDDTIGASDALSPQIQALRERVMKAEDAVETFRAANGLFESQNNASLSTQQLGEVNTQLSNARAQQAESAARAKLIRDLLRDGRPVDVSDVTNNDLIRRLVETRVTLQAGIAQESRTLLPGHPRMKELRAQLADLEARIVTEAERTVRSLENDALIAGARVASLEAALDRQKESASRTNEQEVKLRALEREAKSERDLLESYLTRYREASARAALDVLPADARIVSRAVPASTPFFPRKGPIIAIATFATLLMSIVLLASGELLSGRASVPERRRLNDDDEAADDPVPATPTIADAPSPIAPMPQTIEPPAPAMVATDLGTALPDTAMPVEAKTPPEPVVEPAGPVIGQPDATPPPQASEPFVGATFLFAGVGGAASSQLAALAFARRAAGRGHSVAFVDLADTQRDGLAEVVAGRLGIGQVIEPDRLSRMHRIAAGRDERCDDASMARLVAALTVRYAIVVLHVVTPIETAKAGHIGPQVEAFARVADTTLLITDADIASEAVDLLGRRLKEAGTRVVLTTASDGATQRDAA